MKTSARRSAAAEREPITTTPLEKSSGSLLVDTCQPRTHGIHVWPVYISAGIPESALAIEDLAAFLRVHS